MDLIKLYTKNMLSPRIIYSDYKDNWGDNYYLSIAKIDKILKTRKEAYSKIKNLLPLSRYSMYPILKAYNMVNDTIYNNKPSKIFKLTLFSYAYFRNGYGNQYVSSTDQLSIPVSLYFKSNNTKISLEESLKKSQGYIDYIKYDINNNTGKTLSITPVSINPTSSESYKFGYFTSNTQFNQIKYTNVLKNVINIPQFDYNKDTNRIIKKDNMQFTTTNSNDSKKLKLKYKLLKYKLYKDIMKYIVISSGEGETILELPAYIENINVLVSSLLESIQGIGQLQPVYTYTKLSKQLNFGFKVVLLNNLDLHVYIYLKLHKLALPIMVNKHPTGRIIHVHFPNNLMYVGYISSINFDISLDTTYILYEPNLNFNTINILTEPGKIASIKLELNLNINKIYPILFLVEISMTVIK